MYLPLLKCLCKCKASTLTQSLSEGKSFTHRLTAVLEQKVRFDGQVLYTFTNDCFIVVQETIPLDWR